MKMTYIVFQDVGAGRLWFVEAEEDGDWTYQELGGNFANAIDEFDSADEAQALIDKIVKDTTKYVIFTCMTEDGNAYWVEKMSANSGTYQEVGGTNSNWLAEFYTQAEAEKHLREDY